ncbi:MAG: murein biosynthesis integral membrane protein MurJ [Candidatus Brocadiales bacterium]|nr:murein biosynthesis integral membrane protein MurJ [Candidatus Brocadiales bacterium]
MTEHSFLRSARTIGLCTLFSRILGLLRDILCASAFGTTMVWDAFAVAFRIPNLFRRLFGEGALTAAFIPIFTEYLEKRGERESWYLVSVVATALFIFLGLIVLLGEAAFYIIPRLTHLDAKWNLTLELSIIMFPYMLFICLAALVSAILNCLRHFLVPALSPAVLNICWILGIILIAPMLEDRGIFGVALAILTAGIIQLGIQLWVMRSKGGNVNPVIHFAHPGLKQITRLIGPVVFGLAVVQINVLMDSLIAVGFASSPGGPSTFTLAGKVFAFPLQSGAASVLYYGDRIIEFPLGVVGVALATAVFPTLSTHVVRNDWKNFSATLHKALRMVLFISIPASVGLIILREPLLELFFQRHAFTQESTHRTASVIFFYSIGIWAYCSLHILIRAFYSLQDTITPVKVGASMVGLNLALSLSLIWFLKEGGLALSTAISAMAQVAILFVVLRGRLKVKEGGEMIVCVGKTLIATALMAVVCIALLYWLPPSQGDTFNKAVRLFVPMPLALGTFLAVAHLLGSEELKPLYRAFIKRGEE